MEFESSTLSSQQNMEEILTSLFEGEGGNKATGIRIDNCPSPCWAPLPIERTSSAPSVLIPRQMGAGPQVQPGWGFGLSHSPTRFHPSPFFQHPQQSGTAIGADGAEHLHSPHQPQIADELGMVSGPTGALPPHMLAAARQQARAQSGGPVRQHPFLMQLPHLLHTPRHLPYHPAAAYPQPYPMLHSPQQHRQQYLHRAPPPPLPAGWAQLPPQTAALRWPQQPHQQMHIQQQQHVLLGGGAGGASDDGSWQQLQRMLSVANKTHVSDNDTNGNSNMEGASGTNICWVAAAGSGGGDMGGGASAVDCEGGGRASRGSMCSGGDAAAGSGSSGDCNMNVAGTAAAAVAAAANAPGARGAACVAAGNSTSGEMADSEVDLGSGVMPLLLSRSPGSPNAPAAAAQGCRTPAAAVPAPAAAMCMQQVQVQVQVQVESAQQQGYLAAGAPSVTALAAAAAARTYHQRLQQARLAPQPPHGQLVPQQPLAAATAEGANAVSSGTGGRGGFLAATAAAAMGRFPATDVAWTDDMAVAAASFFPEATRPLPAAAGDVNALLLSDGEMDTAVAAAVGDGAGGAAAAEQQVPLMMMTVKVGGGGGGSRGVLLPQEGGNGPMGTGLLLVPQVGGSSAGGVGSGCTGGGPLQQQAAMELAEPDAVSAAAAAAEVVNGVTGRPQPQGPQQPSSGGGSGGGGGRSSSHSRRVQPPASSADDEDYKLDCECCTCSWLGFHDLGIFIVSGARYH